MAGTSAAMTYADWVWLALRYCREGVFADLNFVMLAAMRAADVERDKPQSAFARWICLRAFNSGVDLLPGRWTREYQSAHDKPFRNRPTTRPTLTLL
jgi:hypothetical protein